jgi:hypothetical protein
MQHMMATEKLLSARHASLRKGSCVSPTIGQELRCESEAQNRGSFQAELLASIDSYRENQRNGRPAGNRTQDVQDISLAPYHLTTGLLYGAVRVKMLF